MWLFALVPVVIIIVGLMLKSTRQNQWTDIIDQHLLNHLLVGQKKIQQSSFSPLLFLVLSLLLAVLALAGPTWEKRPLPVFETEMSKVIMLDLSLSMNATDIKPSRLVRARHKIKDLLSKTKEGQVALIVYAGDAFVISPLTTDANTILTMIPPLSPSLMPVLGSEPQTAFKLADDLLTNAGVFSGQIIWITDGINDKDYGLVAEQLKSSRHQISILAVGTNEGSPIPLADEQGFLKDTKGGIVIPSLHIAPLEQLANIGGGNITRLTADDSDIEHLLSALSDPQEFISSDDDLEMDTWVELGPWLLIPVLLVVVMAFRKGVVVALLLTIIPIYPSANVKAAAPSTELPNEQSEQPSAIERHWKNLWQTSDQQAAEAFQQNEHKAAADLFQQQDWKSAAMYKSGQYNAANDLLSNTNTSTADYNKGNTLAQLGRLEESIAAYESALTASPDMEDAKFNKALVEEMLKQKQEEEQQQEGDEQEQNQDQQQDGEQQEGDQENDQEGEEQEQQEGEEQEGEEQEGEEKEGEEQQSELEQMTEAEKEQVLEQWLRMIKDDPGGLLRRKMYMEYQRRQQQGKKLQDKGEEVW